MALPQQPGVQLPLDVQLRDDATLDNFYASASLLPVTQMLAEDPSGETEPMIFLHGATGCGKSHLLQAACHSSGDGSVYLPLAELRGYDPEPLLASMDSLRRICLDDLQEIAGQSPWESALFHLITRARDSGCQLVFAADRAPRQLPLNLADLSSRLSWGLVFRVPTPDDDELAAMLRHRAQRRGLQLAPDVARYIVTRAPRDPDQLIGLLDRLDRESLSQQRAMSIPFVRQVLHW